jgi:hypothetical protein
VKKGILVLDWKKEKARPALLWVEGRGPCQFLLFFCRQYPEEVICDQTNLGTDR